MKVFRLRGGYAAILTGKDHGRGHSGKAKEARRFRALKGRREEDGKHGVIAHAGGGQWPQRSEPFLREKNGAKN